MSQGPSIYGYTNFRSFLADYYKFRKETKRGYSFRQFSQAAGFSAPNVLKLVIDGQRNISGPALENFIQALGLKSGQAQYFRCLVQMNQADNDEERTELFEKLRRLIPSSRRYELDADAAEYLSHWIYPVLREMVLLDEFRDDPYWIQRRLNGRIELKEIVGALNFLKKKGFIQKDEEGRFKVKDDIVITSDEVKSMAIRTFHRRILEQAMQALEDLSIEQREFGALIFQIPSGALPELKSKLKTFRHELHEWALEQSQDTQGRAVVQLNLQMFPQTKRSDT
jgi:uncharacterized protein (TIGR02147 family)